MEEEFIIFQRAIVRDHKADSLFVKFACKSDNELQFVQATNVVFKESFQLMTPSMVVTFTDGSGDFINNNRLDTEAIFELHFGRDVYESYKSEYKIAHINAGSSMSGSTKATSFQVIFVNRYWEELAAQKRNRGWSNARYTDVINTIASEGGFTNIEIEPSDAIIPSILQPNWSDSRMVQYVQENARPQSRDGHYEFCGRLDNTFLFKSTSQLIKEGIDKYRRGDLPVLRLGGQPKRDFRDEMYTENNNVPISFTDFSINENYMSSVKEGGSAIESSYYDWFNRQYVKKTHRYEDMNVTQLSEWSLLRQGVDFTSKRIDGGRDANIQVEADNRLMEVSHAVQEININIEGQYSLRAGDVVEVIIPNALGDSTSPYNELYSGFYMISQVMHQLTLMNATAFVSQLVLVRHGVDGKEDKGYKRSNRGRVRFD